MPESFAEPFRLDDPREWLLIWANPREYERVKRYLHAFNTRMAQGQA